MKPTVYLRFEKFDIGKKYYDFYDCAFLDREKIGNFLMEEQKGFRFSQVVDNMLFYHINNLSSEDTIKFEHISTPEDHPYIIPVAVQYSPVDWCDLDVWGYQVPGKKSLFELINPVYLKDLQDGKAMLLIDQSVEGYHATWLWQWFHDKCTQHFINPSAIIYSTGDQACVDTYAEWCKLNLPDQKIKVIPSITLTTFVNKHYRQRNLKMDFDEIAKYKRENKDKLYLYDCTNMRPRPHRVLNFLHLISSGLLEKGNVSMSEQSSWKPYINLNDPDFLVGHGLPADVMTKLTPDMTPLAAKHNFSNDTEHYFNFVERILDDMYRNSWVSLVTESSYFDYECNAFISEKTFKPIASMQPFIILGSKGTLKYLRRLGYKTFHPFIDESYDDVTDGHRFNAIMETIKKIEAIEDKAAWYESMREILEHNHKLFMEVGRKKSAEHEEICKYYFEYFKDKNV